MPIYEYEALDRKKGCKQCLKRFETIQGIDEKPLTHCPRCGGKVRKVMSWCRAAVMDIPEEQIKVQRQISDYEKQGMWSHAAELADKHSEKSDNYGLKMRALENYEKAGYDASSLEKHAKPKKNKGG